MVVPRTPRTPPTPIPAPLGASFVLLDDNDDNDAGVPLVRERVRFKDVVILVVDLVGFDVFKSFLLLLLLAAAVVAVAVVVPYLVVVLVPVVRL